ncbi:MAG: hypothetical protein ACK5IP_02340, partial [Paracoccus sp. (in: a-proteobacteria)]
WKAAAPDAVHGSLSVSLGGCSLGNGPAADARASVLVRMDEGGDFLPLISDAPLSSLLDRDELAAMRPCDA